MEKFKWVIIILLALVLVFVVFFNKNSNEPKVSNFVEFSVKHTEKATNDDISSLINEGNYLLLLDEVQIINENAFGFHLKFSLPLEHESMVFVFDMVDTTSIFDSKKFPIIFTNSSYFSTQDIPLVQFYRSYAKVGFSKTISPTFSRENTLPFINIYAKIEKLEIIDDKLSLELNFNLTHSDLLLDVLKFRYLISGKISITEAIFTERIISLN